MSSTCPPGPQVGDTVEVFSRSHKKWLQAVVTDCNPDGKFRVEYEVGDNTCAKIMEWPSREVRLSPRTTSASKRSSSSSRSQSLSLRSSSKTEILSSSRSNTVVLSSNTALQRRATSNAIIRFLSEVQLFKRLPKSELARLATGCQSVSFAEGQVLIRQGDVGDAFFVIVEGRVRVTVDCNQVATLESGDHFGENALLQDEPRGATVTAETPVSALLMSRDKFDELELRDKLDFPRRQAVGGGMNRLLATRPPSPKTFEERALMLHAIKSNANLQDMLTLDDTRCNKMIDVAWKEHVPAGKEIIKEGDHNADYFYIVQDGLFSVHVQAKPMQVQGVRSSMQRSSQRQTDTKIGQFGSFGELALLYLAPRAATVTALVDSTVWVIDRVNFKQILTKPLEDKAKEYIQYLDRIESLSMLTPDQKMEVAKALRDVTFKQGADIVKQGERGETLYILYDGEVSVIKDGNCVAELEASVSHAHIFGERALLGKGVRSATVQVTSEVASLLAMDKSSVDFLFSSLEGRPSWRRSSDAKKIRLEDLERLGLLGCGGFGAVELVEHRVTKAMYALKGLSKGYVLQRGDQKTVMNEKSIQLMCDTPFIVKLFETFNSPQNLYFLLELALGGDLFGVYSKRHVLYGSRSAAQFYLAGTVFAFEHLHSKKIVHRDLKPENLLVTGLGHVKLTDMGLAKVVIGKTYTTCGTSEYFAPEVIASVGHDCAVDWWTLGILTFELMHGKTPFSLTESSKPVEIYGRIRKGINQIEFPKRVRGSCEDFIKDLCHQDPRERLPMRLGGTSNIKEHTWFQDFDWDGMESLKVEPPYKPKPKRSEEIANFGGRLPPQIKYQDDGSGWDKKFATSA